MEYRRSAKQRPHRVPATLGGPMAKKLASHRVEYSKDDIRKLKDLIKAKMPMVQIAKQMGRTAAGVRMKARVLGINPGGQAIRKTSVSVPIRRQSRSRARRRGWWAL